MDATSARAKAENTSDRELVVTRVFDAPQSRVFDAWTDPQQVSRWWGPYGFTTTIQEMDVRPGGNWRLVMRGPDGRDYKNRIVFMEVVKPERLVFRHQPEPGTEPSTHQSIVTFEKEGEKTKVTMRLVFESPEVREQIVKQYRADEGGKQTFARLAEHLEASQKSSQPDADGAASANYGEREITLTRVFNASRELVFEVWTNPKHIAQWWGPRNFTNPVCEVDARVGGKIRIHMQAPDGSVYPMKGQFLEVVEPEKLIFTNIAVDADGNHIIDGLTTVTLSEHSGKTTLTLTTRGTAVVPYAANYLKGMEAGWSGSLEKLEEHLATC